MSGKLDISDAFRIEKDGRKVFDSSTRPPQLVPAATINTSVVVDFPDLYSGTWYRQGRDTTGPGGFDRWTCISYDSPVDQEWGPGKTYALADAVIGSVPAGVDYIDVELKLVRTRTPSQINLLPISVFPPQNQWMHIPGEAACVVEWHGPLRRMFWLEFVGTNPDVARNIILRRRQSLTREKSTFVGTRPGGQGAVQNGNYVYWFSGPNAPYAPIGDTGPAFGFGAKIEERGPLGTPTRPARFAVASNNPCSEDRAAAGISYQSTFTVDFKITPGRVSP